MRLNKSKLLHVNGIILNGYINENNIYNSLEPNKNILHGLCTNRIKSVISELQELVNIMESNDVEDQDSEGLSK